MPLINLSTKPVHLTLTLFFRSCLVSKVIASFLAKMGDKTQVATVALAARYESITPVVAGTAFGMLLTNVPTVYFGERIANRLPLKLVHGLAALIFAVLGIATLLGAGAGLGF